MPHFDQLQPADVSQQNAGLLGYAQFARGMAGRVISDLVRKLRAHLVDSRHAHQELGKLMHPFSQRQRLAPHLAREQLGIELLHHGRARTRRTDHVLIAAEDPQESFGAGSGIIPMAAVERGLAAAGLIFGEYNLASGATEHRGRVEPNLRKKLVDKTRDK